MRNAAINAVVVAWKEEGDRIFQMIGKMSDKDKAMLDERIRRSGVSMRAKGLMSFLHFFFSRSFLLSSKQHFTNVF